MSLPTWALAEADSLIDLIRQGPRNSARDVLAASLQHALRKGQLEGMTDMAKTCGVKWSEADAR